MRKSSPIDPLINRTTQGLLAATVLQPDRCWYLSDLAKHLRRRPSSLQIPLGAGIGRHPLSSQGGEPRLLPSECGLPILARASGADGQDGRAGRGASGGPPPLKDGLEVAFVHGSVAKSSEVAASDVDVVVIGSMGLADLSPILAKAEQRLGRPVNANVYSPQEFAKKLERRTISFVPCSTRRSSSS